jgi:threonine/homoserine/homoserine lactone efflux protein
VTSDLELPASQTVDAARPAKQPTAEEKMRKTVIKSVAVSVPLAIAFFVGLVALAVHNQQPDWNAWLSMAVGIGVIAGVFFGLLLGFTLTSHNFE